MAKTYGIGIIGAGNIASAYLKLSALFKRIEIRAIADIAPKAAESRAEEFKLRAQSPDELLQNSEIDLVVNLTIPSAHYQVSMAALSAGKHVYSEKPFVLTLDEGKSLKRAAEERNLRIGSAPDTFLGGSHQQARDIMDSGKLGPITSGTAHVMSAGMPEHWHPNPEFFFKPGAGPILDLGPYYVTALIDLIGGPVRRVASFAGMAKTTRRSHRRWPLQRRKDHKVETPTTIHGLPQFQSGAIVTLGASWDVRGHGHNPIELYGEEGTLYLPDPNFFGGDITITDRQGSKLAVPTWEHPFGKPNYSDNSGKPRANYRAAGLADLLAGLETGKPARCGIDISLHVVDVMTSLLNAAATAQIISLTTTCERPEALRPEEASALLA